MTLRQLEYFRAVAERGHLTRAAEELHISQPSLSYTIGELEKEFDMPLFEKSGRQLVLTRCGTIFYGYVKQALEDLETGVNAVTEYINSCKNITNIGYVHTIASVVVDDLLNGYQAACFGRGSTLQFNHMFSNLNQEVLDALFTKRLNFAFTPNLEPGIDCVTAFNQELYILVAKTHPLANQSIIPFCAIENEPMARNINSHTMYNSLDAIFSQHQCIPNVLYQANNLSVAISYALKHACFTVTPLLPTINFSEFSVLIIQDFPMYRPVYLAWKKGRHLLKEETQFIEYVKDSYDSTGKRKPEASAAEFD